MGRGDSFGGSETDVQDMHRRDRLHRHVERLCTIEEIFRAGWDACREAENSAHAGAAQKAFEEFLETKA
jgi:hypothetical protein